MPRGGTVKVITKQDDNQELMNMFNQMLDPNQADVKIVYPKYVSLKKEFNVWIRLLQSFTIGPLIQSFNYEMTDFIEATQRLDDFVKAHDYTEATIVANWATFKNDPIITELVLQTCANLGRYKNAIINADALKGDWIGDLTLGTRIFSFSDLDIGLMWASPEMQEEHPQKYLLMTLHMLYKHSRNIYELTTSPDVDIRRFSEVIVAALVKLKKTPGLERCSNAFKLIERSVDRLEDNFKTYYRDMLQTNNPNIIFESFITDIATDDQIDTKTAFEFKRLIRVLNSRMNQARSSGNPEVSRLFSMVEDKLHLFDDIFAGGGDTSAESGGGSGSATPPPPKVEASPVTTKKKRKRRRKKPTPTPE